MTTINPGIWRREWNQIRLALGFMTRLPVGNQLDYSPELMHDALRWFPLAGWLLAALQWLLFSGLEPLLGLYPALVILVAAGLLFTGALHEDGLADCFDGFYGGMTRERRLEIMKDSRLGTYGSAALVLNLLLRLSLLAGLAEQGLLVLSVLIAAPLSRSLAITHAQDLTYVSAPGISKSDPLARPLTVAMLVQLLLLGSLALWWLPLPVMALVLLASVLLRWWLKRWMYKHIGGFTGDSLGAAQQLQELMILMVLLALGGQGIWA